MSFFYNEASLERPSIALKQCICGVGISSDNVRLPEMESERDAVDHLLWFSLPQVSFSPTARERTCLNLFSVFAALQQSLSLVNLTGEIGPTAFHTERHLPQTFIFTCAFAPT